MKHVTKYGLKILGFLFFAIALGFTAVQSYTLILEISGSVITAMLGLIMFEFAAVYWWLKFQYEADGIPQLALSLLMSITTLSFVLIATALELGAVAMDAFGPQTANMLVTAAVIANVTSKMLYPLLSQEKMQEISTKALKGMWILKAFAAAERQSDQHVQGLSDQIGKHIFASARTEILTDYGIPHALPANTAEGDSLAEELFTIEGEADIVDMAERMNATPPQQEDITLTRDEDTPFDPNQ